MGTSNVSLDQTIVGRCLCPFSRYHLLKQHESLPFYLPAKSNNLYWSNNILLVHSTFLLASERINKIPASGRRAGASFYPCWRDFPWVYSCLCTLLTDVTRMPCMLLVTSSAKVPLLSSLIPCLLEIRDKIAVKKEEDSIRSGAPLDSWLCREKRFSA